VNILHKTIRGALLDGSKTEKVVKTKSMQLSINLEVLFVIE
jgi:hypothetical protein